MSNDGASLIDDHLLALTRTRRPKVCFIPTASGDSPTYCARFEHAFAGRAQTSVLSLFCVEPWGYTSPSMLLDQDAIYVGGSTANLLAVWRHHGLPEILRQAAAQGTLLAGISAGMNCWFEASSTDSYGPLAPLRDGLGFLSGGACPHLFGSEDRWPSLRTWVASGEMPMTHAVDDHVALLWHNGVLTEAWGEEEGHSAFRLELRGTSVVDHEIPVRLLS